MENSQIINAKQEDRVAWVDCLKFIAIFSWLPRVLTMRTSLTPCISAPPMRCLRNSSISARRRLTRS